MRNRTLAWRKDDPWGAETARVELWPDHLWATGVAIGSEPEPYRLDYELVTGAGFVTRRLVVEAAGEGWSRRLELTRSRAEGWAVDVNSQGPPDWASAGGALDQLADALDPDLGLSPLFNTMPVLRARIHGTWTYVRPDGSRTTLRSRARAYTPHELAAMLERAGLRVTGSWGSFDGDELTMRSFRIALRAEKE